MCRKASWCSELGQDPEKWSQTCPLLPPSHFNDSLGYFIDAYNQALDGKKSAAISILGKIPSDEMREWFEEHGSYSGHKHRVNLLDKPLPERYQGIIEKRKYFSISEQRKIFQRDAYLCRYCGTRVIDEKILKTMETLLGRDHFKASGNSNAERHGVVFFFRATVDHVLPISSGGQTTFENGVTSCWNCNYGKYTALLEQMNIIDPRDTIFDRELGWDGLLP
jgi:hypothetical protein